MGDGSSTVYEMRAEVGLLGRSIVIEGENYNSIDTDAFGGRVLVGAFNQGGIDYKGMLKMQIVFLV